MVDLDVVKQHCRIDTDFSGDDALLTLYTGAAARYVQTWTRRTLMKTRAPLATQDDPDPFY